MSPAAQLAAMTCPALKAHRMGLEAAEQLLAQPQALKLDWERFAFTQARKLAREAINLSAAMRVRS